VREAALLVSSPWIGLLKSHSRPSTGMQLTKSQDITTESRCYCDSSRCFLPSLIAILFHLASNRRLGNSPLIAQDEQILHSSQRRCP
jgi:hypothetical protein